jgi:hypothetical protein
LVEARCRLLPISRSSLNYAPQGKTVTNLELTRLIEKQFLDIPFCGVQKLTWPLQNEGHAVNEKRSRCQRHPIRSAWVMPLITRLSRFVKHSCIERCRLLSLSA